MALVTSFCPATEIIVLLADSIAANASASVTAHVVGVGGGRVVVAA